MQICLGEHYLFPESFKLEEVINRLIDWRHASDSEPVLAAIDLDPSDDLRDFITTCLTVNPAHRPTAASLLNHPFLQDVSLAYPSRWRPKPLLISSLIDTNSTSQVPYNLTLSQLFYLWRMNGGDVEAVLLKHGVSPAPCIERIPYLVKVTEDIDQLLATSDALPPYSDEEIVISLAAIRDKLASAEKADKEGRKQDDEVGDWKSVLPWTAQTLERDVATIDSETPKLSLGAKEKDVAYQARRLQLFTKLLCQYPTSRDHILREAAVDIPPVSVAELAARRKSAEASSLAVTPRQTLGGHFGYQRGSGIVV